MFLLAGHYQEAVSQVAASEMPASLSYSEVRGHNQASDCWLIISGTVYDLTQFADDHPGGAELIHQYAGRDATSAFLDAHSLAVINAMLPDRCVRARSCRCVARIDIVAELTIAPTPNC